MKELNNWLFFGIGMMGLILQGCGNSTVDNEEKVEEISSSGKLSEIYRNPVSLETPNDTVNVAKMAFEEDFYDFGELIEGDVVHHEYKFTNTGTKPLLISDARSTCGCTIPKWPKSAIAPGKSGVIKVKFDSKNKKNKIEKPITITANTFPADTKIYIRGFVKEK